VEELLRKLLLSAVVVLIDEGSPLQVTLAVLVSGWAHVLHAQYKPWGAGSVLYSLQHGALFVTGFVFLMGLLFKVDGVSSSSGMYTALSVIMVTLCVVFMAAWVAVIVWRVVATWRAPRDSKSTSVRGGDAATPQVSDARAAWRRGGDGGGGGGGAGGGGSGSGGGGVGVAYSVAAGATGPGNVFTSSAASRGGAAPGVHDSARFLVVNPLRAGHSDSVDGGSSGGGDAHAIRSDRVVPGSVSASSAASSKPDPSALLVHSGVYDVGAAAVRPLPRAQRVVAAQRVRGDDDSSDAVEP
jgi:hypothetical protein